MIHQHPQVHPLLEAIDTPLAKMSQSRDQGDQQMEQAMGDTSQG